VFDSGSSLLRYRVPSISNFDDFCLYINNRSLSLTDVGIDSGCVNIVDGDYIDAYKLTLCNDKQP
jgi:hypothetical protein